MEKFDFAQINEKTKHLFDDTKNAFEKSDNKAINALSSKIPSRFVDENRTIKIAFAGQYSAGKSTILSLITGIPLEIGQGVTTAECTEIDWNGVTVVDTPGVATQNRPDHDKITMEAVADADLIVFVATQEGFSNLLGKYFRKMAIDEGKGHEMMLVINKMEGTVGGNTPEQQKIVLEKNILPVISPEYGEKDFYIAFVDAKSFEQSLKEEDEEEKQFLTEISGFELFNDKLNQFVKEKNFLGRCTTTLYKLEQLLQDALAEFKSGDACVDGTIHLLNQQRKLLNETRDSIVEKAYNLVRQDTQKVVQWGDDIANDFSSEKKQDQVNQLLKEKYDATNNVYSEAVKKLEELIGLETGKLQEKIETLSNTTFAVDLKNIIKEKIENVKIDGTTFERAQKAGNVAKNVGEWLAKYAAGAKSADLKGLDSFFKISGASGSSAHNMVLSVGHLFGHKFAPWEAVKFAGKIGQAGKILGAAGAFIGVGLQIVNDCQESKMETQLLTYRNDIRNSFRSAANEINMQFDKSTHTWIAEALDSRIKDIDSKRKELTDLVSSQEKEFEKYQQLLNSTRALINSIQTSTL